MGDMLPGWSFQVLTHFPCIEYCFGKFSLAGEHFDELLIVMSRYNTCVFSVWYFSVTRETKANSSNSPLFSGCLVHKHNVIFICCLIFGISLVY